MTEWWRPLATGLRHADRFGPAGRLARRSYRTAALGAARLFEAVDEVDAVYLAGSLTRPRMLRPGISDIDLVISADLPTARAEERLRRKLGRAHRAVQSVVPAFSNLDYFESRDLDYLRFLGNAWCLDLDVRWLPLAGTAALRSTPPFRPRRERDLIHLARCLKRWMKSSRLLGRPPRSQDLELAQRLLGDVIAGWLDIDRLSPLAELLDRAPASDSPPALSELRAGAQPTFDLCMTATLQLLDHWARQRTGGWRGAWPVSQQAERPSIPPAVERVAARVARDLNAKCLVAPRGSSAGGALLMAVAEGDVSLLLGRMQKVVQEHGPLPEPFDWAPWPILLTPALYRALALAAPEPFVAPAVDHGAVWLHRSAPPPPLPSLEDLRVLLGSRTVRHFLRRLRRPRRAAGSWQREQDYEQSWLLPALRAAWDDGTYRLTATEPPLTSAETIPRLRNWLDDRRARLTPELERRKADQRE